MPKQWALSPEPVGDWLGDAFLDEEPIAVTAIRSLLQVVRIAGDETFERTIRRRLEAESVSIARAHDRFVEQLSQLERVLDELAEATTAVDPERRAQQRIESVTRELAKSEDDLRLCQKDIGLLNEALLAKQRLTALTGQLPNIENQLERVMRESQEIDKSLRSAQDRQARLLGDLARGSQVEDLIKKTRKTRDARLKRFQNLASKVQRAAAQLEITAEIEAIAAETIKIKTDRRQIQSDLASAGHNASVRAFTSRVVGDLDVHRELDPEVVAVLTFDTEEELRLSARELRTGIQRRQVELTEVEDDPLRRGLTQRDRELSLRLNALGALRVLVQSHKRAHDLLGASDGEIAALVGRAEATAELRAEYGTISAEITALETESRLRLSAEARLRVQADQLSAGKSEEEINEDLNLALSNLHLEETSNLDQRLQTAKSAEEEHRVRVRQLRAEHIELQGTLAFLAAEIGRASGRVAALTWLPISIRQALARDAGQQSGQSLLTLRNIAESLRASLYSMRNLFDQLLAASRNLANEVGQRDRMQSEGKLQTELAAVMGDQLQKEFNQEEISSALFDGGQLRSIDLRTLEARWITNDGTLRSRPFEAFSSGEQVFAYTRARIQRVASQGAKHKVIALDEFGAFLARDRLERLARYLRDAVLGSIADQVIIVVPLAANYASQAKVTRGDLGERFARRAEEIKSRRYFAEDATQRELV